MSQKEQHDDVVPSRHMEVEKKEDDKKAWGQPSTRDWNSVSKEGEKKDDIPLNDKSQNQPTNRVDLKNETLDTLFQSWWGGFTEQERNDVHWKRHYDRLKEQATSQPESIRSELIEQIEKRQFEIRRNETVQERRAKARSDEIEDKVGTWYRDNPTHNREDLKNRVLAAAQAGGDAWRTVLETGVRNDWEREKVVLNQRLDKYKMTNRMIPYVLFALSAGVPLYYFYRKKQST